MIDWTLVVLVAVIVLVVGVVAVVSVMQMKQLDREADQDRVLLEALIRNHEDR